MSNVVNERFTEDYPESYKAQSDVKFAQELIQADANTTTMTIQECALARRESMGAPQFMPLTPDQLRTEYEYIRERLFGEEIALDLYQESSRNFDQEFRDSVDEIGEDWREKFERRFGRDPPFALPDYFFPRRTLSLAHRRQILQVLDAEYARLVAEAAQPKDTFMAIPLGLYRSQQCRHQDEQ